VLINLDWLHDFRGFFFVGGFFEDSADFLVQLTGSGSLIKKTDLFQSFFIGLESILKWDKDIVKKEIVHIVLGAGHGGKDSRAVGDERPYVKNNSLETKKLT
jgi:hypothetical protein